MDPPVGVLGEQRRGHLRAAGVVDAEEQHFRHLLGHDALGLGEGRSRSAAKRRASAVRWRSTTAVRRRAA
jgi:hypothetical protein